MSYTYTDVLAIHKQFIQVQNQYWTHHVVFTFNWWLLVVLCMIVWGLWCKTVDKTHIREIVLYGAFVLIVTTTIDGIGTETLIWSYPIRITPTFARFIPVDFVAVPMTYMWLYQYFQTWKSFWMASITISLIFSFGLEPLLDWMGIYEPTHWHHIYSFPLYIAIATSVRWMVKWIWNLQGAKS